MNWLENNPVGAALLALCGFLMLAGLALTFLWSGSVDPAAEAAKLDGEPLPDPAAQVEELGALRDYDIVNTRPLFNESRRPVVIEVEAVEEAPEVVVEQVVAEAPRVRLTGVVITPEERVVTLTPESGGKPVVIREGMPLEGEFVGWSVDQVQPRLVSLLSATGESIDVELAVHDAMIARPPEPEPRVTGEEGTGGEEGENAEDASGETLSRADEIRERIRQRREQLRAEAEQEAESEEDQKAFKQNAYQDAIRSMMNRNAGQEEEASDEESGDE